MVTARFGADGMSLLLAPGEAECRSPPRVHAAANHRPWFETAAGAESISQRGLLVTLPVRVYCCSVDNIHDMHQSLITISVLIFGMSSCNRSII